MEKIKSELAVKPTHKKTKHFKKNIKYHVEGQLVTGANNASSKDRQDSAQKNSKRTLIMQTALTGPASPAGRPSCTNSSRRITTSRRKIRMTWKKLKSTLCLYRYSNHRSKSEEKHALVKGLSTKNSGVFRRLYNEAVSLQAIF